MTVEGFFGVYQHGTELPCFEMPATASYTAMSIEQRPPRISFYRQSNHEAQRNQNRTERNCQDDVDRPFDQQAAGGQESLRKSSSPKTPPRFFGFTPRHESPESPGTTRMCLKLRRWLSMIAGRLSEKKPVPTKTPYVCSSWTRDVASSGSLRLGPAHRLKPIGAPG